MHFQMIGAQNFVYLFLDLFKAYFVTYIKNYIDLMQPTLKTKMVTFWLLL